MARTQPVRNVRSRIQAIRVLVYVHSQEAIGAAQFPSREYFPLGERLDAVRSAAHLVAGNERKHGVIRHRIACQYRRARFRGAQICVVIVEGREIERERTGRLDAIADFIGQEILGAEEGPPKTALADGKGTVKSRSARGKNALFHRQPSSGSPGVWAAPGTARQAELSLGEI